MRVAVGSDHAGFVLKTVLAEHLRSLGHEVLDLGTYTTDRVDYPDYGAAVGRAVTSGEARFGVAVCGSGIGIAMAAGKVPGVRAATVHDVTSARLTRQHNDANVLCLGERLTGVEVAREVLEVFLATGFDGGRHTARVAKLADLDLDLATDDH
ncbi:MAG: ribose 5-phosphate isomerase B [Acidimicrobiales bacterium]